MVALQGEANIQKLIEHATILRKLCGENGRHVFLYLRVKVVLMEHSTKSLSPKLTCTSNLYKASLGEGGGGRGTKGNICPPFAGFYP